MINTSHYRKKLLGIPGLLLVMLMLALSPVALVSAKEGNMVTYTFKLTLYGGVPGGDAFSVEYKAGGKSGSRWFCGKSVLPCKGNGSTFVAQVSLPKGETVKVHWNRWTPGDAEGKPFSFQSIKSYRNTTSSAWFDYSDNAKPGSPPKTSPSISTVKVYLKIYGKPEPKDMFTADYRVRGKSGSVTFCGDNSSTPCQGNGKIYTATLKLPTGSTLQLHLNRWKPGDPEGNPFFSKSYTVNDGMNILSWYSFKSSPAKDKPSPVPAPSTPKPSNSNSDTSSGAHIPTSMPDTGGGGLAAVLLASVADLGAIRG